MKIVSFGLNNQAAIPKQTRQEQRTGFQALAMDTVSFSGRVIPLCEKKAEIEKEIEPLKLDPKFKKYYMKAVSGDSIPIQAYIAVDMKCQLDDDHKKALSIMLKHAKNTLNEQPVRMAVEDICEECKLNIADLEK